MDHSCAIALGIQWPVRHVCVDRMGHSRVRREGLFWHQWASGQVVFEFSPLRIHLFLSVHVEVRGNCTQMTAHPVVTHNHG